MGNCACVYVGNYDGPDFTFSRKRKAKKEHVCCECGEKILPGSTYEYTVGRWEAGFRVYKTCLDCISMIASFFCDGFGYTTIWEDLAEHIDAMGGEISSDCLIPLTPKARAKVCQMIEDYWDEEDERTQPEM